MEHLDLQLLRKEEIDKKKFKKRRDGPIFDYLQIILKNIVVPFCCMLMPESTLKIMFKHP